MDEDRLQGHLLPVAAKADYLEGGRRIALKRRPADSQDQCEGTPGLQRT